MTVHSRAWSVLYFLLHHLNLADRWVQINTDNLFWGKFSVSVQSVSTTLTLDLENIGGVQREGEEGISSVTSVDFRRVFFYAWLNICTSFTTVVQQAAALNGTGGTLWTVSLSLPLPCSETFASQGSSQGMQPALVSPACPSTACFAPCNPQLSLFSAHVHMQVLPTLSKTRSKATPLTAKKIGKPHSTSLGRHSGLRASLLWSLAW